MYSQQDDGSGYYHNFMISAQLSTEYQDYLGFGNAYNNGHPYGKKSADGRTFYWYNPTSEYQQYNANNTTYRYIAFS